MPPSTGTKWWVWVIAIVVLIGAFFWWDGRGDDSDSGPELGNIAADCPQHVIAIDTNGALPGPIVNDIPIASETDAIPEFHDCQRFASSTRNGYGPLIAIWSSARLASAFEPVRPQGDDDGAATRTTGSSQVESPWVPVAQVYNFDADTYQPLGIEHRFNCLYLRQVPPSPRAPDGWIARMVPRRTVEGCKANREGRDTLDLVGADLLVKASRPAAAADIPPVARWDREPTDSVAEPRQYVGIRCADSWCEIGPRGGFVPSVPVYSNVALRDAYLAAFEESPSGSVSPDARLRVIRAKGWYDQQLLAQVVGTTKSLTRSDVFGTIIPHPTLDVIDDPTTFDGAWLPAAYVHVSDTYTGKSRFEQGMNRVYLCRGTATRPCPGREPVGAKSTPSSGAEWLAIVAGATVSDTISIHYDGSPGVIPAGAARWRWMETDEKAWMRCAGGCCSNN